MRSNATSFHGDCCDLKILCLSDEYLPERNNIRVGVRAALRLSFFLHKDGDGSKKQMATQWLR